MVKRLQMGRFILLNYYFMYCTVWVDSGLRASLPDVRIMKNPLNSNPPDN